jgi:hypothetical protein
MVTFFIIVIVLINSVFVAFIVILTFVLTIILGLKTAFLLVLCLCSEACFGLTHLVEFLSAGFFIIFENLVLLVFLVLVL